jgi:hypothetical protein
MTAGPVRLPGRRGDYRTEERVANVDIAETPPVVAAMYGSARWCAAVCLGTVDR